MVGERGRQACREGNRALMVPTSTTPTRCPECGGKLDEHGCCPKCGICPIRKAK